MTLQFERSQDGVVGSLVTATDVNGTVGKTLLPAVQIVDPSGIPQNIVGAITQLAAILGGPEQIFYYDCVPIGIVPTEGNLVSSTANAITNANGLTTFSFSAANQLIIIDRIGFPTAELDVVLTAGSATLTFAGSNLIAGGGSASQSVITQGAENTAAAALVTASGQYRVTGIGRYLTIKCTTLVTGPISVAPVLRPWK